MLVFLEIVFCALLPYAPIMVFLNEDPKWLTGTAVLFAVFAPLFLARRHNCKWFFTSLYCCSAIGCGLLAICRIDEAGVTCLVELVFTIVAALLDYKGIPLKIKSKLEER